MTSPARPIRAPIRAPIRTSPIPDRIVAAGAMLVLAAVGVAFARHGSVLARLPLWLAIHLATAMLALPLGAWVFLRRKGDRLHRLLGRTWALLMLAAALSSFALTYLTGRLSVIHILSVVVLVTVPRAVWRAMRGDIAGHQRSMTLIFASLVIAGGFTLLPGRLLGAMLVR